MKLITFISIAALVATASFGQNVSQQNGQSSVNAVVSPVTSPTPPVAPVLNTSKIWRLALEAQSAHDALNQTPQGKAAQAADQAVQEEQAKLSAVCGKAFQLQLDSDPKSSTFKDLICATIPSVPAPLKATTTPAGKPTDK